MMNFSPPSHPKPSPNIQRLFALAVVGWCVFYGCFTSVRQQPEDVDQVVFRRAVQHMQNGQDYYAAMNSSLIQMYGPSESMRAFRLPGLFVVWSWLPSMVAVWWLYLALVVLTGLLLLRITQQPALPLIVVIYLTTTAVPRDVDGWLLQFTTTELWLVPFMAATLWAWRTDRNRGAALFAALAFLVRETALGMILGGLLVAIMYRRAVWPWLVALAVAVAMLAYHYLHVKPLLVPVGQGCETQLYGTGSWSALARMAGYWLPHNHIVGPIIWALGLYYVLRHARWAWPLAPTLMLPITGIILNRPHWGNMVVPFYLLFTGELLTLWYARWSARRTSPVNDTPLVPRPS